MMEQRPVARSVPSGQRERQTVAENEMFVRMQSEQFEAEPAPRALLVDRDAVNLDASRARNVGQIPFDCGIIDLKQ
ncbi:MAG: hypothetical protein HZA92_03485 [Verrucomicrobia bacterium]|nr:hypothetical protein [Verrucomicrobiota bacterium]